MIKQLWNFNIEKEEEKIIPQTSKNEAGEEVTVNKKEVVKVPYSYYIRKPNRVLSDEAILYYSALVNNYTKRGVPSKATIAKRIEKEGLGEDENEQKEYLKLYADLFKKQEALTHASLKPEAERTEEDKKKIDELLKELAELRLQFQKYISKQESLYENTVESLAQTKTMVWWLVNLAYSGDNKLFFGEGDLESKLNKLEEIEEGEDPFLKKVLEHFYLGISFWVTGKAQKQAEFDELLKSFNTNA